MQEQSKQDIENDLLMWLENFEQTCDEAVSHPNVNFLQEVRDIKQNDKVSIIDLISYMK